MFNSIFAISSLFLLGTATACETQVECGEGFFCDHPGVCRANELKNEEQSASPACRGVTCPSGKCINIWIDSCDVEEETAVENEDFGCPYGSNYCPQARICMNNNYPCPSEGINPDIVGMCMKGTYYCHGRCLGSRYRCPEEAEEPEKFGICFKGTYYCQSLGRCVDNEGERCPPESEPAKVGICFKGTYYCQSLGRCVDNEGERCPPEVEPEVVGICCKGYYYCQSLGRCVWSRGSNCPAELPATFDCEEGSILYQGKCTKRSQLDEIRSEITGSDVPN